MKENVFRIISKFQLSTKDNPEKAIDCFLDNLLKDLKKINLIKLTKVASNVLPAKAKILSVRVSEADHIIDHFNDIVERTNEDWEYLLNQWNSPRSFDMSTLLAKKVSVLEKEYDLELYHLSIKATAAIANLQYVDLNYGLKSLEKKKVTEKVTKLRKITLLNFNALKKYLKSGKLPML